MSTDEKTGIQALERNAPDLPMSIGQVLKREYEYTRHGTLCLIANWDVVEGKILSPTISETRQEEDFLRHIQQTVQNQPDVKGWRIITDNLNTHQSESLVVWVASLQGIQEQELGIKGKKGILKSMESRAAFLQQNDHFVHFMYTPKHCSWLNQIEIWFGILARKVIRRGNFKSKQELAERLMQFIQYFNAVLSKPFKWNYGGKPCYT